MIKAKEDHVNHLRQEINLVSSSMPFVEDSFPINLSIIETNPFHKESWFLKNLGFSRVFVNYRIRVKPWKEREL